MEKEFRVCLLCFKVVSRNILEQFDPFIKKEMLSTVYPQMEMLSVDNLISCSECERLLNTVFNFKSCCLDVDDYLRNFLDCDNRIDLDKVFIDMNGIEIPNVNFNKKEKLCRLCLDSIQGDSFTTDVDKTVEVMMKICLPEVDLKLTNKSVFCEMCLERLQIQFDFVSRVATLEKTLNSCDKDQINQLHSLNVINSIKSRLLKGDEEKAAKNYGGHQISSSNLGDIADNAEKKSPDLKSIKEREEYEINNVSLYDVVHSTERTSSLKAKDEEKGKELESSRENNLKHTNTVDTDSLLITNEKSAINKKHTKAKVKTSQYFMCSQCEYSSKENSSLKLHALLTHSNVNDMISVKISNEVKTYICNECNFESTRDYGMWSHILIHKDKESSPPLLKCTQCSYKCRKSNSLTKHMKTHKSPQLLHCHKCSYTTFSRSFFFTHYAKHLAAVKGRNNQRELSRVYQCTLCSYKIKRSAQVTKHFLHHVRRSTKIFECKTCSYKTNFKLRLDVHELAHARGEASNSCNFFKCYLCGYETENTTEFLAHTNQCLEEKFGNSTENLLEPVYSVKDTE